MKKEEFEMIRCPQCGLQKMRIDERNYTRCPVCEQIIKVASEEKEREHISIHKLQKNQ